MLFFVNIGLSPSEAGMVNGLQNLAAMIGAPLSGLFADKLKMHRSLCLILGTLAFTIMCSQPFLTASFGRKHINVCKQSHNTNRTTEIYPETHHKKLYYSILATSIIASSFDGSVMNFVDSGVIHHVQKSRTRCEYGQQRYIGAFGSAVGSLSMGFSIKFFPQGNLSCYNGIYITYSFFSILLLITCNYLLKAPGNDKLHSSGSDNNNNRKNEDGIRKCLWDTITRFDNIVFLLDVLFNGAIQAISFTILYLYLQELNAPTLLFGLSMSLNAAASAIVFYLSKKLIRVFRGTINGMCVSCFFWSARLLIVAFITNPYYVIFADLLNGITYSLYVICMMEHIKDISHPSIVSTMTGVVNGLYNHLSFTIASIIGGSMYHKYGGRVVFVGTAIACLIWSSLMLVYILVRNYRSTKKMAGKCVLESVDFSVT